MAFGVFDEVAGTEKVVLVCETERLNKTQKSELEQALRRLTWMVLAVGLLVSGVNLRIDGRHAVVSNLLLLGALLAFLWGVLKKSAGR